MSINYFAARSSQLADRNHAPTQGVERKSLGSLPSLSEFIGLGVPNRAYGPFD